MLEITWVDGKGDIHVSPRNSTAGRALVGGLGVAGIVTELLLQLQPSSHTKLKTRFKQSDISLLADVKAMLQVSLVQTLLHTSCSLHQLIMPEVVLLA